MNDRQPSLSFVPYMRRDCTADILNISKSCEVIAGAVARSARVSLNGWRLSLGNICLAPTISSSL